MIMWEWLQTAFLYHQFSMEVRGILLLMVMIMLSKIYKKLKKKTFFLLGGEEMILLSWPKGRGDVIPFGLTWGIQYETPSLLIVKYFRATKEKNWFRTKECHLNFYGTWSKCSSFELSTSKGEKRCNFLQYQY